MEDKSNLMVGFLNDRADRLLDLRQRRYELDMNNLTHKERDYLQKDILSSSIFVHVTMRGYLDGIINKLENSDKHLCSCCESLKIQSRQRILEEMKGCRNWQIQYATVSAAPRCFFGKLKNDKIGRKYIKAYELGQACVDYVSLEKMIESYNNINYSLDNQKEYFKSNDKNLRRIK